jgi:probable rRNA maturation factor
MPVDVQLASGLCGLPEICDIQKWADATLEELGEDAEPPDLCIRLVDAAESRTLNYRYRGTDKPTNVLSFAADADVPGTRVLGDLVICAPVVLSEAQSQKKSGADHFAHMVVHGVLHLLGHDHEVPEAASEMEGLELRVLTRLGVPDPYQL